MNKRDELIEKAKKFWAERADQPASQSSTRAEAMADFALSVQEKPDACWEEGDTYWYLDADGIEDSTWGDYDLDDDRWKRGIYCTREEADLADRQRIARTVIHRWIEQKAEKVDDYRFAFSPQLFNGEWRMVELQYRIPEWFFVKTTQDFDRMMSENAQHFDVLKEGM